MTVPRFPAEVLDVSEIATADEIKQQIVTLNQTTRSARFVQCLEDEATLVVIQFETTEWNTVMKIDSDISARSFDLTKAVAISTDTQVCQVMAETLATAALMPLARGRSRIRSRIIPGG